MISGCGIFVSSSTLESDVDYSHNQNKDPSTQGPSVLRTALHLAVKRQNCNYKKPVVMF